jgi:hypothetical protein
MATSREDGYLRNLSDKDLREKFRETIKDIDTYKLGLENSNNLLESLEAELIKRAVGKVKKVD